MNKKTGIIALTVSAIVLGLGTYAVANASRDAIIQGYAKQAGVSSFSAAAGKALFLSQNTTGKPDTPSCSTCHTTNPTQPGRTRVGKVIDPMAVSRTPNRFTDPAKVEKWFRRNCKSVLGRECTPKEKGEYITYMNSI